MNRDILNILLNICYIICRERKLYVTRNRMYISRFSDILVETNELFKPCYPLSEITRLLLASFNDRISAGIFWIFINLLSALKKNSVALYEYLLDQTLNNTLTSSSIKRKCTKMNLKSDVIEQSTDINAKYLGKRIELCIPYCGKEYYLEGYPVSGKINWCLLEGISYSESFKKMILEFKKSYTGVLIQKSVDEKSKEILLSNRILFVDIIGEKTIKQIQHYTGVPVFEDPRSIMEFIKASEKSTSIRSKISYRKKKVYGRTLFKLIFYETLPTRMKKTSNVTPPLGKKPIANVRVSDIDQLIRFHILLVLGMLKENNVMDEKSIVFFKEKDHIQRILSTMLKMSMTFIHLL